MNGRQRFINPDGAKVKRIFVLPIDGDGVAIYQAGEDFDAMFYCSEFLGEYGIDWVQCINDGRLVAQFNAKHLVSVEFEEGPITC